MYSVMSYFNRVCKLSHSNKNYPKPNRLFCLRHRCLSHYTSTFTDNGTGNEVPRTGLSQWLDELQVDTRLTTWLRVELDTVTRAWRFELHCLTFKKMYRKISSSKWQLYCSITTNNCLFTIRLFKCLYAYDLRSPYSIQQHEVICEFQLLSLLVSEMH